MEITKELIKLHLFVRINIIRSIFFLQYNSFYKYECALSNCFTTFKHVWYLTSYNLCYSVENRTMIGKVGNERECFEFNVSWKSQIVAVLSICEFKPNVTYPRCLLISFFSTITYLTFLDTHFSSTFTLFPRADF